VETDVIQLAPSEDSLYLEITWVVLVLKY